MKRFHSNVGASQRSLEQRPEVFHTVHMHPTANIRFSLVNNIVNESALHSVIISNRVIRIDRAPELDVLENLILQSLTSDIRHDAGAILAEIPVKDALTNRLVVG